MKKTYFVLSDIHSFYTIMMKSLFKNGFEIENKSHVLLLCGDAFDRGEESVEMFEFLKRMQSDGRLIYIRGNHEDLLKDCYREMLISANNKRVSDWYLNKIHFSNGTVSTIEQLCKPDNRFDVNVLKEKIEPVIDFIDSNCVDYYEIDDKIFVHGWIPLVKNWREAPFEEWSTARWTNGMLAWKCGNVEDGKTIICGHWHCSWGWSHLFQDRKEFPQKNRKDFKKSFEPFVQPGIMAIDACTSYSGIVNVYKFEA